MFSLFRRSNPASVPTPPSHYEWSPVALTELVATLLRQMTKTGRFMGALDSRRGFKVRTMIDGSEQAVSTRTRSRAVIADHDVTLTLNGADACKVASNHVATAIKSYLDQTIDWRITQEDGMTIWRSQVTVRGAVILMIECRAARPMPELAELTGPCTELSLQLRKIN